MPYARYERAFFPLYAICMPLITYYFSTTCIAMQMGYIYVIYDTLNTIWIWSTRAHGASEMRKVMIQSRTTASGTCTMSVRRKTCEAAHCHCHTASHCRNNTQHTSHTTRHHTVHVRHDKANKQEHAGKTGSTHSATATMHKERKAASNCLRSDALCVYCPSYLLKSLCPFLNQESTVQRCAEFPPREPNPPVRRAGTNVL
jgi:hypothetical protein